MLILLPLAAFIAIVLALHRRSGSWRPAIMEAAVIWGLIVVVAAEGLSPFHWFGRAALCAVWLVTISVTLLSSTLSARPSGTPRLAGMTSTLSNVEMGLLLAGAMIIVLVGLVAIMAPPNTWDAMEYHMPRAFFWMQQHSIAFYPTPDLAQLILSPFAELVEAQNYILAGSDRFANCGEFVSLIGSVLGVSLIAKRLGGSRLEQIVAGCICLTIPEGVLEASGAMNTYVLTFWVVSAVYFALEFRLERTWRSAILLGGSVGLAVLTKGLAFVYLPPLLLGAWLMRRDYLRPAASVRAILAVALIAICIDAGFFIRNFRFTGTPLGTPFAALGPDMDWANSTITVGGTVANILRNISLHLGAPHWIWPWLQAAFRHAISLMGQNPDDPTHVWLGDNLGYGWWPPMLSRNEIWAGNPLHLLLAFLVVIILLAHLRDRRNRDLLLYCGGLIVAFVVFCALIRYTIWSSRYHLALFALGSPLAALVLLRYVGKSLTIGVVVLALIAGVVFATSNQLRALRPGKPASIFEVSRSDLYFADQHLDIAAEYETAARSLVGSSCRNVGIVSYMSVPGPRQTTSPRSFFVYPLLALLYQEDTARQFRYLDVENPSVRYQAAHATQPCVVICLYCKERTQTVADLGFARNFGRITVFSRAAFPGSGSIPASR